MPYRNMTLPELARHIGMDAREVKRLADRGVLPGHLIGGEWRFNRAQMLEWLQSEMHTLDEKHVRNLDRAMSETEDEAVIESLLATEGIEMALPARSRPSVLRELVKLAERTGLVWDSPAIIEALEEPRGSRVHRFAWRGWLSRTRAARSNMPPRNRSFVWHACRPGFRSALRMAS